MEYIEIIEVLVSDRKLNIKFQCSNHTLATYFETKIFQTQYSLSIESVPESVLVIPFLVQILPLSWIRDFEIRVKEIDKDFYEAVPNIKQGYVNMYPMFEFNGKLTVKSIVDNKNCNHTKRGTLFSGGVDACATLIAHAEEHPDLIIIQGSDIHLDQPEAWKAVLKQNDKIAELFNVESLWISSNYCEMLNYDRFNKISYLASDNWWHGFQHGIGLLGLCAPLAYIQGYDILYIASSHTDKDRVNCASDPTIDNFVKMCGCRVVHDQYEFNRIEKLQHIVKYCENIGFYPYLRVCYFSGNENNCCKCEKCLRTAISLSLMGQDITKYGFIDPRTMFKGSKWKVIKAVNYSAIPLWDDIQKFARTTDYNQIHPKLKWVLDTNFYKKTTSFRTRLRRYLERKIKHLLN